MIWPGGHGILYGMTWRACHGFYMYIVWPRGHAGYMVRPIEGMVYGMAW